MWTKKKLPIFLHWTKNCPRYHLLWFSICSLDDKRVVQREKAGPLIQPIAKLETIHLHERFEWFKAYENTAMFMQLIKLQDSIHLIRTCCRKKSMYWLSGWKSRTLWWSIQDELYCVRGLCMCGVTRCLPACLSLSDMYIYPSLHWFLPRLHPPTHVVWAAEIWSVLQTGISPFPVKFHQTVNRLLSEWSSQRINQ